MKTVKPRPRAGQRTPESRELDRLAVAYAKTGSDSDAAALLAHAEHLITYWATPFEFRARKASVGLDDLKQIARMELLRCTKTFKPERGIAFSTYAGRCATPVLCRQTRRGGIIRIPERTEWRDRLNPEWASDATGVRAAAERMRSKSFFSIEPTGRAGNEYPVTEGPDTGDLFPIAPGALDRAVDQLNPVEQSIIRRRYLRPTPQSWNDIAAQLRCSRQNVFYRHATALRRLRLALKGEVA